MNFYIVKSGDLISVKDYARITAVNAREDESDNSKAIATWIKSVKEDSVLVVNHYTVVIASRTKLVFNQLCLKTVTVPVFEKKPKERKPEKKGKKGKARFTDDDEDWFSDDQ